jgi:hypothetical protein
VGQRSYFPSFYGFPLLIIISSLVNTERSSRSEVPDCPDLGFISTQVLGTSHSKAVYILRMFLHFSRSTVSNGRRWEVDFTLGRSCFWKLFIWQEVRRGPEPLWKDGEETGRRFFTPWPSGSQNFFIWFPLFWFSPNIYPHPAFIGWSKFSLTLLHMGKVEWKISLSYGTT